MSIARTPSPLPTPSGATAISKDGYEFDPADIHWRLNKDVLVSLGLAAGLPEPTRTGFRLTLQRYAEEMSARHTENMAVRFNRYLADTRTQVVSAESLLNWRAMLGGEREWHLGGLKGFLIAWADYEYPGVPGDVVELLTGLRIKGNRKGTAVIAGCPETGPLTDLEMAAVFDWANAALGDLKISLFQYGYLLTLAMTARRPSQIAALRGVDLTVDTKDGATLYRINCPRAKQRGGGFRLEFRSLAIIEDLYLVLSQLHRDAVRTIERQVGAPLSPELRREVPVFLNEAAVAKLRTVSDVADLLLGTMPDALHAKTASLDRALRECARGSRARSERTGEFIRLTATRFRYTRGTKLRREGFGAHVIAELLDHKDTQQTKIYTQNTAQEAVIINALVGRQLAPFAQACLGKLVRSERDAVRGDDPRSRVSNQFLHAVGTCGSYGFCASGYQACYTCSHFQPWVDGPHEEVLADLCAERERTRAAGCAEVVVAATDRLILAVAHCVQLCAEAKSTDAAMQGIKGNRWLT